MMTMPRELLVRHLGTQPYVPVWEAMKAFVAQRNPQSLDEIWVLQHPPVFTLGSAGKPEHLLVLDKIPVIRTDRGGQVTYHGPGQLVVYLLLDIRRLQLSVRGLVSGIENAVLAFLAEQGVSGAPDRLGPGVYVAGAKVASLGLRIRRGRSYHGLSVNVDMDLSPFSQINPCGNPGLRVTDLRTLGVQTPMLQISQQIIARLAEQFGYESIRDSQIRDSHIKAPT